MKRYKNIVLILLIVFIASCKPELDSFEPSKGNADFSKYIALGNSLTAGYKDGALFKSGQEYSYPNILAQQFKLVGGDEFKQPLMFDELGLGGRLMLGLKAATDCNGNVLSDVSPSLSPIPMPGIPSNDNFDNKPEYYNSNNLGVPGAKSFHLLIPGYGLLNTYYGRFSMDLMNSSILTQAVSQNPTFFTLWIGNNDILTYALAGGEADSITSVSTFTFAYGTLINSLTQGGAKGAVANIPDINEIAYFTTIPYNGLVLTRQGQADSLTFNYLQFGIQFSVGPNGFIIQDSTATGGRRQIKANELVLLSVPQDSIRCAGWGSVKPIPANFILDETEIAEIKFATQSYNQVIFDLAFSKSLAFVDGNQIFKEAKSKGLIYDGVKLQTNYITGGLNSIDGIHLTPRGNALVANKFIEAINKTYKSNIPLVDITEYPGIIFP